MENGTQTMTALSIPGPKNAGSGNQTRYFAAIAKTIFAEPTTPTKPRLKNTL